MISENVKENKIHLRLVLQFQIPSKNIIHSVRRLVILRQMVGRRQRVLQWHWSRLKAKQAAENSMLLALLEWAKNWLGLPYQSYLRLWIIFFVVIFFVSYFPLLSAPANFFFKLLLLLSTREVLCDNFLISCINLNPEDLVKWKLPPWLEEKRNFKIVFFGLSIRVRNSQVDLLTLLHMAFWQMSFLEPTIWRQLVLF